MKFFSLLRRLPSRFRDQPRSRKVPPPLSLEALEARIVPTVPAIVAVSPANGSTLSGPPSAITVTFNEPMQDASISNQANYAIFNSKGEAIAFKVAANAADTQVTI